MTRTTHRSTTGKKLYAKRAKTGRITDIQTHKRASAADQRKRSKAEGIWVRWVVYIKSGTDAGCVLWVRETRAAAIAQRNSMADTPGRKWAVAPIEIHAGVPDPLRRRK